MEGGRETTELENSCVEREQESKSLIMCGGGCFGCNAMFAQLSQIPLDFPPDQRFMSTHTP